MAKWYLPCQIAIRWAVDMLNGNGCTLHCILILKTAEIKP
jgi:hypothetical protein